MCVCVYACMHVYMCVCTCVYIYRKEQVCIFDIYFQMATFLKMVVYIYIYDIYVIRHPGGPYGKNFAQGLEYRPR